MVELELQDHVRCIIQDFYVSKAQAMDRLCAASCRELARLIAAHVQEVYLDRYEPATHGPTDAAKGEALQRALRYMTGNTPTADMFDRDHQEVVALLAHALGEDAKF